MFATESRKTDLHTHPLGDRKYDADDYDLRRILGMFERFFELNIKIIGLTDHVMGNKYSAIDIIALSQVFNRLLVREGRCYRPIIIPGLEVGSVFSQATSYPNRPTVSNTSAPHLLVYGAKAEDVEQLFDLATSAGYNRPQWEAIAPKIEELNLRVIIAHPFRDKKSSADQRTIKIINGRLRERLLGMELPKAGRRRQELAYDLAEELGLLVFTNSDAHDPSGEREYYFNLKLPLLSSLWLKHPGAILDCLQNYRTNHDQDQLTLHGEKESSAS